MVAGSSPVGLAHFSRQKQPFLAGFFLVFADSASFRFLRVLDILGHRFQKTAVAGAVARADAQVAGYKLERSRWRPRPGVRSADPAAGPDRQLRRALPWPAVLILKIGKNAFKGRQSNDGGAAFFGQKSAHFSRCRGPRRAALVYPVPDRSGDEMASIGEALAAGLSATLPAATALRLTKTASISSNSRGGSKVERRVRCTAGLSATLPAAHRLAAHENSVDLIQHAGRFKGERRGAGRRSSATLPAASALRLTKTASISSNSRGGSKVSGEAV